jgi:hypothetical protein
MALLRDNHTKNLQVTDKNVSARSRSRSRSRKVFSPSVKKRDEKFSEIDLLTAQKFFGKLELLNPNFKKPNFESWANEIRLMREQDNRPIELIELIFNFANQDNFWKNIILSPKNLREKFDRLQVLRESQVKKTCAVNPVTVFEKTGAFNFD